MNVYPFPAKRQRGLPELIQVDPMEVLIGLTGHEIAHLDRWDRFGRELRETGKRDSALERDTERLARTVLTACRRDRQRLLVAWGDAGPGPVRPGVIHRITCRRCGYVWESARAMSNPHRRSCKKCFPGWDAANAVGEFLVYERIEGSEAG